MRLMLVGGGLANSLIAYRLAQTRPEIDWTILEAAPQLGGNHTWSFHETDLTAEQNSWLASFVECRWASYAVAFPGLQRELPLGYCSVSAERLRGAMAPFTARIRTNAAVASVTPTTVQLEGGEILAGDAVIDGRGYAPSPHLSVAYQKFLGLEVRTQAPHGLSRPIIMDATVPQADGFRFVYVLPLAADRLLIEDTYYSDRLELDVAATRALVRLYACSMGWTIAEMLREEMGVLPITLGGDIEAFWAEAAAVPRSGLRAALFHPTTGYSLPHAVRLAEMIASLPDLRATALFQATRDHSIAAWKSAGFYRLLDRLLFRAAEPDQRYRLLERFYRLSPGLIGRFYAGRSTILDKARVLSGKPPVPILAALRCLPERAAGTPRP